MTVHFSKWPDALWVPLAAMTALVPAAVLAAATRQLFLFASLGPTAIMVVQQSQHRSARAYNVVVGHTVGAIAGFTWVYALGLSHAPSIFVLQEVTVPRALAALGALGSAAILESILKAQHPPAASTTLLIALGSFHPIWRDIGALAGGIVAVAAAAEALRRLRLSDTMRLSGP